MAWVGEWAGGRVWEDERGRKTYHIRKMVAGKRFEASTRCHSLRAAMAALDAFDRDPHAFRAGGVGSDRLVLDKALIDRFCAWSSSGKGNTAHWVTRQRTLLTWWSEKLAGHDLRRVDIRHDVVPVLEGVTLRAHRIAVLKALYSWLRKREHAITSADDPTRDLTVPQAKPAQWTKSKVVPRQAEEKLLAALGDEGADVVRLLSATGCHVSEVGQFAARGEVERRGHQFILVLPHTKGGGVHRLDVSVEVAEVAKRILARGPFSESAFNKAFAKACKDTRVGRYGPGNFRHTFATRAIEAGATPESVAAYLHHKSTATTLRFYATLGVVPRPALPGAPKAS